MQDTLAKKLRVIRAREGLTLRQAAKRLGVTPGTLSELERGLRHPHDLTLSRIARGYGVPVEELLEEPALAEKADAPSTETAEAGRAQEPDSMNKMCRIAWRDALNALAERWEGRVKDGLFTLDAADEFFLTLVDIAPGVSDVIKTEVRETEAFINEGIQSVSAKGAAKFLEWSMATGMTLAAKRLLDTADAVFVAARRNSEMSAALNEVEQHYREAREALVAA